MGPLFCYLIHMMRNKVKPFVFMKHKLPSVWGPHVRKVFVGDVSFMKSLGFVIV